MSTFANYSEAASVYDSTRKAEAYEIWLGAICRYASAPINKVRLLDGGCGTGNYAAALAPYVGRLNGIDFNPDMLAQAEAKLGETIAQDRARLEQGSLLSLPFEDATFDAMMINQVLHHLEDGTDTVYNGHRAAISEAARLLKPGGVLMVNTCSHRQLTEGFWYNHLIPQGLEACKRRVAPTRHFRQLLDESGLSVMARHVPAETIMQGDAYFNLPGVLDPDWRAGDSIWAMAPLMEVEAACNTVHTLLDSGESYHWLATHDEQRQYVGQLTFWIAIKPASPFETSISG